MDEPCDKLPKGLAQLIQWPRHHLEQLSTLLECDLDAAAVKVMDKIDATKYSTSFSGVDAPGTSLTVLRLFAAKHCNSEPLDVGSLTHTYGIEVKNVVCAELLAHPHKPCCLFGDIVSCFSDPVHEMLPQLQLTGNAGKLLRPLLQKPSILQRPTRGEDA